MSELTDRLAQEIWQAYVVETGRAMPEGLADKIAALVQDSFQPIDVADLKARLKNAATMLDNTYRKALCPTDPGMSRLAGKAEGIRLALSYVNDAERVSDA